MTAVSSSLPPGRSDQLQAHPAGVRASPQRPQC
jgi:hypothetical protein